MTLDSEGDDKGTTIRTKKGDIQSLMLFTI